MGVQGCLREQHAAVRERHQGGTQLGHEISAIAYLDGGDHSTRSSLGCLDHLDADMAERPSPDLDLLANVEADRHPVRLGGTRDADQQDCEPDVAHPHRPAPPRPRPQPVDQVHERGAHTGRDAQGEGRAGSRSRGRDHTGERSRGRPDRRPSADDGGRGAQTHDRQRGEERRVVGAGHEGLAPGRDRIQHPGQNHEGRGRGEGRTGDAQPPMLVRS